VFEQVGTKLIKAFTPRLTRNVGVRLAEGPALRSLSDSASVSDAALIGGGLRQITNFLREGKTQHARDTVSELLARAEIPENRMLSSQAPQVQDVLELVRHAHSFDMPQFVRSGLDWSVDLLSENQTLQAIQKLKAAPGNGQEMVAGTHGKSSASLKLLREGDAIATLALTTGNVEVAQRALLLARPHLEEQPDALATHLKRLRGETERPRSRPQKAAPAHAVSPDGERLPLSTGVKREQQRLEGMSLGFRQSSRERRALIEQIEGGKVPFLEGVQRLKERNPQHKEALGFLETCVRSVGRTPERGHFDLRFVLEDDLANRRESAQRLLRVFEHYDRGSTIKPEAAAILAQRFLEIHPEYQPIEGVRLAILAEMRRLQTRDASRCFVHAPLVESPSALLGLFARHGDFRGAYPSQDDRSALALLAHKYTDHLTGNAEIVRFVNDRRGVRFVSHGPDGLRKAAASHIWKMHRQAPGVGIWLYGGLDHNKIDLSGIGAGIQRSLQEREQRIFGALNPGISSDSQVFRSLSELTTELESLAKTNATEARRMLNVAVGFPDTFWLEQKWEGILPLLRVADHQGWHDECKNLFQQAVKLAESPEQQQQLVWLGRIMNLQDSALPSVADPGVGKKIFAELLASARTGKAEFNRMLDGLNISKKDEQVFWEAQLRRFSASGEDQAHLLDLLFRYAEDESPLSRNRTILGLLEGQENNRGMLDSGLALLREGASAQQAMLLDTALKGTVTQKQQVLRSLQQGLPEGATVESKLKWLSEGGQARTQAPVGAVASKGGSPAQTVLAGLDEAERAGRVDLGSLRTLAQMLDADTGANQNSQRAVGRLLRLMLPQLEGNEKLLAQTALNECNLATQKKLLARLAAGESLPGNPIAALAWLYTETMVSPGGFADLSAFDLPGNPNISELQRALNNSIFFRDRRGIARVKGDQVWLDALSDASHYSGDLKAAVFEALGDLRAKKRDNTRDSVAKLEPHYWVTLLDVSRGADTSERAILEAATWSDLRGAVADELYQALKSKRYEHTPLPEAMFDFLGRLPEGEPKVGVRRGTLRVLKRHYEATGDERSRALTDAAIPHKSGGAVNDDRWVTDGMVHFALQKLSEQV